MKKILLLSTALVVFVLANGNENADSKSIEYFNQQLEELTPKDKYKKNLLRCIEIANEISKTKKADRIQKLREEGINLQDAAFSAWISLQNPEYQIPNEKIKKMVGLNSTFFGIGSVFADKRITKLPPKEYRKKVIDSLEKINSTKDKIELF